MMKNVLCLGALCILLFAGCNKDDRPAVCPENGDFGVDVVSGPSFGLSTTETWMYLSDEAGNIRDEQTSVSYPAFLNWTEPCQATFSLNIGLQASFSDFNGGFYDVASMNTYYGIPSSTAFRGIPYSYYPSANRSIAERTITITEVPNLDSILLLSKASIDLTYSETTQTIRLAVADFDTRWRNTIALLGIRLPGETDFSAIMIDLTEELDYVYEDFTTTIEQRHIQFTGHELSSFSLSIMLSEEERESANLFTHHPDDDQFDIWVPQSENSYIINYTGEYESGQTWTVNKVVSSIPTMYEEPPNLLVSAQRGNEGLNIVLNKPSYFRARPEYPAIIPVITTQGWTMEGPVAASVNNISFPPLSTHNEDLFSSNFRQIWTRDDYFIDLSLIHHPDVPTLGAYWEVTDLPWREQLNYQTVSLEID